MRGAPIWGFRVHLMCQRWDEANWLDAADMFVGTSLAEGMPVELMEAMAKGLPVMATAVSGIPEELGFADLKLQIEDCRFADVGQQ
jgi:glycosyltransferase involved in cell wall biosynthesis